MAGYLGFGSYAEVEWIDSHGESPGQGWTAIEKVRKRETQPLIITSVGIVVEHNPHGILLTMSRQGSDYIDSWLHIPKSAILHYKRLR